MPLTRMVFDRGLSRLYAVLGDRRLSRFAADTFYSVISKMSDEDFAVAVEEYLLTGTKFPAPAELLAIANNAAKRRARQKQDEERRRLLAEARQQREVETESGALRRADDLFNGIRKKLAEAKKKGGA